MRHTPGYTSPFLAGSVAGPWATLEMLRHKLSDTAGPDRDLIEQIVRRQIWDDARHWVDDGDEVCVLAGAEARSNHE